MTLVGSWENRFKMDRNEIKREDVEWIQLAQDSVQRWTVWNTILNIRIILK
jgi:hypothetical protein